MSITSTFPARGRLAWEAVRVDLQDDAQCAQAYAVEIASRELGRPWDDHDGYEATVVAWRYDDPAERFEMFGVADEGRLVGVALVWFPLDDNTDKAWSELHVHPAARRCGVGTALAAMLEQRTRDEGRHELLTEAMVAPDSAGGHPYERFAAHVGFRLESTDRIRLLDLPTPTGHLDELAEAARPRWSGAYRLETHVDGLPQNLVPGYCRVSNRLVVDAPSGAVTFEEESLTPERYHAYLDIERAQERTRLTTVGIEQSTGEVVAFTDLMLPSGAPTKVWQWGTLVDPAHRGHRLGMAVKVANLEALQRGHPERTTVGTANDETNAWMVDINVALGFRIVELCRMYRRVLVD